MTRYVLAINVDDERMRKDERFREYIELDMRRQIGDRLAELIPLDTQVTVQIHREERFSRHTRSTEIRYELDIYQHPNPFRSYALPPVPPPTGDRKAFIDALNLNPGDVTTRLVYADWLDEHGEPDEANRQRGMVTTPVTVDL